MECPMHHVTVAVSKAPGQLQVGAVLSKSPKQLEVAVDVLPVRYMDSSGIGQYTGSYEFVPKFYDQSLATKNKILTDDVVCKEITVSRVSNDAGGKTVWIGEI